MEQSPIRIPDMRVYLQSHSCETKGFSLIYANVVKIRIWPTHHTEE